MSVTNIVITLLSIFSIFLLSATFFIPQDSEVYRLIGYFDFSLCAVFLIDFLREFFRANDKWRYMYTAGWLDLLSSIPMISEFRYIRIFRIFRVFRIIKSFRLLWVFIRDNRAATLYGLVLFISYTTLVLATTGVLYVEKDVGNIQTAEDALWWSYITITTVGYGDYYPVTTAGKILASILIFCGIATFGTAISYINEKVESFKREN